MAVLKSNVPTSMAMSVVMTIHEAKSFSRQLAFVPFALMSVLKLTMLLFVFGATPLLVTSVPPDSPSFVRPT
jgi:hypothetical protein